jgi:YfiH family protein
MSVEFLTAGLPARHGFFTRNGGVSTGLFASLNCSLSGSDDPASVQQNRALVAQAISVTPQKLLGLKQVHEAAVVHVTLPWAIGAGPRADAMFTTQSGIALGVITADCAPVLFSDAAGTCVGAAHAGWRGAVLGVLEATGMAMRSKGATGIRAVIGPCIQQPSYEVGADLRDTVLQRNATHERFFAIGKSAGKWQFDLPGYCMARLASVDIPVTALPHDTCAEEDKFFSHRRRTLRGETALGHQISVIRTV